MVKRKEISQEIRNQALGLWKGNYSLKNISQIIGIQNLPFNILCQGGNYTETHIIA